MNAISSINRWEGLTQEQIRAQLAAKRAVLSPREIVWRDRHHLLQARGYALRPRYHPEWVASWQLDTSLNPQDCEDYMEAPVRARKLTFC